MSYFLIFILCLLVHVAHNLLQAELGRPSFLRRLLTLVVFPADQIYYVECADDIRRSPCALCLKVRFQSLGQFAIDIPVLEGVYVDRRFICRRSLFIEECLHQSCRCHEGVQGLPPLSLMHGALLANSLQIMKQGEGGGEFDRRMCDVNGRHGEFTPRKAIPKVRHAHHR